MTGPDLTPEQRETQERIAKVLYEARLAHDDTVMNAADPPGSPSRYTDWWCKCGHPIGPYDDGMDDRWERHIAEVQAGAAARMVAEAEQRGAARVAAAVKEWLPGLDPVAQSVIRAALTQAAPTEKP